MRVPVLLVALAVLTPPLLARADVAPTVEPIPLGERHFVLVMEGARFNGQSAPNAPLLEAFVGETLHVVVLVPPTAEAHTFHMHGHRWADPQSGRVVDTVLLKPGDVRAFDVRAGGEGGYAGDWFYHCHMDNHFMMGMWGVLRVHPFSTLVEDRGSTLAVQLHRLGAPLEGARLTVTAGGVPVDAAVTEAGGGRYLVSAPSLLHAAGPVVVVATHALGESVARLDRGHAPASSISLDGPATTGPSLEATR